MVVNPIKRLRQNFCAAIQGDSSSQRNHTDLDFANHIFCDVLTENNDFPYMGPVLVTHLSP